MEVMMKLSPTSLNNEYGGAVLDLSPVQKKIFLYFEDMIRNQGDMPSLRKAAEDNGVSHAAIAQTIKMLEKKGYIQREGRYGRRVRLLKKSRIVERGNGYRCVPVVGAIAAGLPLYAQEDYEGALSVDSSMFKGEHLFALRIKGDSMKDAGILNGDYVVCEPRQFAENGDIVVALIKHEEATVKRFYLRPGGVELRPDNEDFKPVEYGFSDVLVQGKVVGLIRGPEAF
jgi:repressor LexA